MPFNGSGVFTLAQPPFAPNTTIASAPMNSDLSDIATGLSGVVTRNGQSPLTANMPAGGYKITNLASGAAATDSITVGQVQNRVTIWCGTAAGSANARTCSPGVGVSSLVAGQQFEFINGVAANTGPATLSVSGLTATAIVREADNAALAGGEMAASARIRVTYNGTAFVLDQGQAPLSPAVGGFVTLSGITGAGIQLPGNSAQKYAYFSQTFSGSGGGSTGNVVVGVNPGGTLIDSGIPGSYWVGFAWRIA